MNGSASRKSTIVYRFVKYCGDSRLVGQVSCCVTFATAHSSTCVVFEANVEHSSEIYFKPFRRAAALYPRILARKVTTIITIILALMSIGAVTTMSCRLCRITDKRPTRKIFRNCESLSVGLINYFRYASRTELLCKTYASGVRNICLQYITDVYKRQRTCETIVRNLKRIFRAMPSVYLLNSGTVLITCSTKYRATI